jgi:tetratricopeptide (TPR) repeat protein
MLGEPDPDSVIADRLSGDSPFTSTDLSLDFSFRELADPENPGTAPASEAAPGRPEVGAYLAGPASIDLGGILGAQAKAADQPASDTFEIDLSSAFGEFGGAAGTDSEPVAADPSALSGLERVFEGFRDEAARYGVEGVAKQFRQAVSLREAGDAGAAVKLLEQVARVPRYRFKAAAELARIHRELGQVHEAIEWLERAAESAPAATEESRELLYDLGMLLSEAGENERALAVFLELQADASDYRDVAIRVGRLSQKA